MDCCQSYTPVVDFTNVRLIMSEKLGTQHAKKGKLYKYAFVLAYALYLPQDQSVARYLKFVSSLEFLNVNDGHVAR